MDLEALAAGQHREEVVAADEVDAAWQREHLAGADLAAHDREQVLEA
jgi:hypothetical protein